MNRPSFEELLATADSKEVIEDWDRPSELMKRFNGLSRSQLSVFQREMEEIEEFKSGVLKPSYNLVFIYYPTFIWYLRWKDANQLLAKKISPKEVLK